MNLKCIRKNINPRRCANLAIWAIAACFYFQPIMASAADIVQIATPSAAGVSRNLYQQLDVSSGGLILNNSPGTVQTQLSGVINGNPNLAGKSANIILNEVTGTSASQLRGFIEVAGQRAEVIIANPNGIVVDGAGFINASRAVLTTGKSVLGSSGSLDAFQVSGGQITIQGAGLDASGTDRADLISRAMTITAEIQAKELNAVAGTNQVDYTTLNTKRINGSGQTPQVAIDVAALGGMYADKIKMVSTERGVGVNNSGVILANTGDITLSSKGIVTFAGQTVAAGNINIKAPSMDLSGGLMNGAGVVSLKAYKGDIVNGAGGLICSGDALNITTPGAFSNIQEGVISTATNLNITSSSVTNQGFISAGGNILVTLQGANSNDRYSFNSFCNNFSSPPPDTNNTKYAFDNSYGFISAGGNMTLAAASAGQYAGNNTNSFSGYCNDNNSSQVSSSNIQNFFRNNCGFISTGGDISLSVQVATNNNQQASAAPLYTVDNANGYIRSGNNLSISVLGDSNNTNSNTCRFSGLYGNPSSQTQDTSINTVYAVNNSNGYINVANTLSITAQDANNAQYAGSYSNGFTGYCVIPQPPHTATISNNQYFINNTSGAISAGNDVNIIAQGDVVTTKIVTVTKKLTTTKCGTKTTTTTTTSTNAQTTIDNTNGSISAGNDLTIQTQGAVNNTQGNLTSDGGTTITAFAVQNQQGVISGNESVEITTKKPFDIQAGQVTTNGSLPVITF